MYINYIMEHFTKFLIHWIYFDLYRVFVVTIPR